MTKVKVVTNETKYETPEFCDLDVNQYFHKFDISNECDDIYIKLPNSELSETGTTFNAYNLSKCYLKNFASNEKCVCIDNVEIHIEKESL